MSWAIENKDYSQRRACRPVSLEPKTYRYASTRPDDGAVRQRLKELALERRRFGHRRLHILLRREGIVLNRKKVYRLYREERLASRPRTASSSPSMAGCATNAPTSTCSATLPKPDGSSKHGRSTTTPDDHTRA